MSYINSIAVLALTLGAFACTEIKFVAGAGVFKSADEINESGHHIVSSQSLVLDKQKITQQKD